MNGPSPSTGRFPDQMLTKLQWPISYRKSDVAYVGPEETSLGGIESSKGSGLQTGEQAQGSPRAQTARGAYGAWRKWAICLQVCTLKEDCDAASGVLTVGDADFQITIRDIATSNSS